MFGKIIDSIRKINDDGWHVNCLICISTCFLCFSYINFNSFYYALSNFIYILIGAMYEQIIEWLAHGWLQHYKYQSRCLSFFFFRHKRHHNHPEIYHALQPITVFVPAVFLLLMPIIVISFFFEFLTLSSAASIVIGFMFMHVILILEHHDIHMRNKKLPTWFLKTKYFKEVVKFHKSHYIIYEFDTALRYDLRVYGITNPWLDILLFKLKITNIVDKIYPILVFNLDKLLLSLEKIFVGSHLK